MNTPIGVANTKIIRDRYAKKALPPIPSLIFWGTRRGNLTLPPYIHWAAVVEILVDGVV